MFQRLFHPKRARQRGQSSVEVLIAVAVLAIVAQSTALVINVLSKQNVVNRDRAYAMEKALQMLEEMRGLVLDQVAGVDVMDGYSDYETGSGVPKYRYTLSTNSEVTDPTPPQPDYSTAANAVSGNWVRGKGYVFVRHVDVVKPFDATGKVVDENMRKVYVRVYRAKPNGGNSATNPDGSPNVAAPLDAKEPPLAEVFGIVRSLGELNQPTQVLDVHLIALENVPGWWSRTSNLIPLMQSSLVSLQARNPGLRIRAHWIRRLSFGRDMEYTPEINETVLASSSSPAAFKKAYVYPGLITYDDANDFYYLPSWFRARMNIDGAMNSSVNEGYALADQWNHAMRYPDEDRLYGIMKTIAANKGAAEPEMSLRMLLEKMNTNAPEMRNSIIINLHGEMVPVLPLRNVSDAAKDPLQYINRGGGKADRAWRVVSHPERLSYNTDVPEQLDQAFRVYAYDMNPPSDPISAANEDDIIDEVTLFVPGADLGNLNSVERVQGNSRTPYYKFKYDGTNWLTSMSGTLVHDGLSAASSTWVADNYTPPGRSPGLRIRLYGVTPTARAYNGPVYVP